MREGFGMSYIGSSSKSQQEGILSLLVSDLPPKHTSVTTRNEPSFPAGGNTSLAFINALVSGVLFMVLCHLFSQGYYVCYTALEFALAFKATSTFSVLIKPLIWHE